VAQPHLKLVYTKENGTRMLKCSMPSKPQPVPSSTRLASLEEKVRRLSGEYPEAAAVVERLVDDLLKRCPT